MVAKRHHCSKIVMVLTALTVLDFCGDINKANAETLSLEDKARVYLARRNEAEQSMSEKRHLADWDYETNITKSSLEKLKLVQKEVASHSRKEWDTFVQLGWPENWKLVKDEDLKRQLKSYAIQGTSALSPDKLSELEDLITEMTSKYSTATVNLCAKLGDGNKCSLKLEPELTELMSNSRNYSELSAAWLQWRDVTGRQLRDKFLRYVELSNEAATLNGFADAGEMWLDPYESTEFRSDVERIWQGLKPLYEEVHAYVRRKLREVYGESVVGRRAPIPAHILGNMWAQTWGEIYDLVVPYKNLSSLDVTEAMVEQGYTPLKMFQLSDEFFTELNLLPMTQEFWQNSVLVRPENTDMVCHASAWDFYRHDDFRIKMCTKVTMEHLFTVHHEMGHIEYSMQYRDLPMPFRTGANPGFHEAVGDALALSVRTPRHLQKLGLITEVQDDLPTDINTLMAVALDKIVFLPFGYLIDKYRWDVFDGNITSENLNCAWWKLRTEEQGVRPSVKRTEQDFDAGAKFHVVSDVPYIRYFVSTVIQFQFHKAMCLKAGQYDPSNPKLPMHLCDIDGSKEAGNALSEMLRLGASKPWPDVLEILTGSRNIDSGVIREYFKPLEEWLKKDNQEHGEYIGWVTDDVYCE